MPTYQAQNRQIIQLDQSLGWTVLSPLNPVNDTRFTVITFTTDLTPIQIDFAENIYASIASILAVMPGATIEFCYSQPSGTWFVLNAFPPDNPTTSADGNGWAPLSLDFTWQTADLTFDATATTHIEYDDVANTFRLKIPGKYQFILSGTFEHNSSNQGRTTNVRFYNVTDGIAYPAEVIGTGRNAEASPFTTAFLTVVDDTVWDKDIRVEFGGGDSYSLVTFNALDLQVVCIEPELIFENTP